MCLSGAQSACWLSTKQMRVIPETRRAHSMRGYAEHKIYVIFISILYGTFFSMF